MNQTLQYRKDQADNFPEEIDISFKGDDGLTTLIYRKQKFSLPDDKGNLVKSGLRYGENPGQSAALYRLVNGNLSIAGVTYMGPEDALISGLGDGDPTGNMMFGCRKHPSKTNLTDVDSALGIMRYLDNQPAVVIIKHNNPSGAALGANPEYAFIKAYEADRIAAFGGAAVLNRPLDKATAELISSVYLEVVAAPEYEEGTLNILTAKPDLRVFKIKDLVRLKNWRAKRFLDFKSLMDGGLIIQESSDNTILGPDNFKPAVAEKDGISYRPLREPTFDELTDLAFGWAVEQGVVSNSVLFVKNQVTVSVAGGQQDRVGVVNIAVNKARRNFSERLAYERTGQSMAELQAASSSMFQNIQTECEMSRGGLKGSVMVSDAFFPFRDGVDVALREGVTAIAHPGGSLRDWECIEAVNQASTPVAMVFTGQRAFKH
jgi:phosphoribosylaminoimidazolecarboxamide formyltransferase/IMP cyclohydrolase